MQDFYNKKENISCFISSNRFFIRNQIVEDLAFSSVVPQFFKKFYLKVFLVLFFGLLPHVSSATHIVGGVMTYVYNGANNYTVSLILYRDCAGAAYPVSTTVQIRQADGTAYTTLTLNPGTATNVPYTLDSCAQAPSPIPCVQKRTYTASITLPPSANGYHLYYSLCCRNSTLSNTTTSDQTVNQDGESFYAFIPGRTIWNEDFTLTNGDTVDTGSTTWTRTKTGNPAVLARVQGNLFETVGGSATTGAAIVTWLSQTINISKTGGANLSADLAKNGTLETGDSIKVYYRLDSGPFTLFTTNGQHDGNNGFPYTATTTTATGTTVQIMVRLVYNNTSPNTELFRLDNILVYNAISNNTPTYTQFPPLFMCAGKAFTFDHSATDTDGDSVYYSFYTPYADAGPTFPSNVATFTPIIWNAGFSATSPLNSGGPALTLNSSTGLLSGTPNSIGQFQVGIKTTEYRKGVKLSDMVRDFQFNIINCPVPAQAYITAYGTTNGALTVCGGTSLTLPNNSDVAATNWTWNFGDPASGVNNTSTLQYPSHTFTSVGTYTARLIINAGTSCADTSTAVVTVANPPAIPTAAGTTICQGTTTTLTATAPGGAYQWYNAASGGTLLVTSASYTTPTLTITTTYYVQTTVSGCTSTRKAVTVTVTPIPAAPTASGATICQGSTATLTATSPGGIYDWYNAASGGTLLITNASYTTPTLTVTTTYYVQTTVAGCIGPRTAATVTVTPTPAAPTASGTTICQGTTAILTATAPGGTYAWYDAASGGTLLITNASYTTPALAANTTYYVQTTVAGCAGPRTAVTVTVTPTPTAPTAAGTTICTGTTATLTATAPGGTYAWYDAASGGTLLVTNASYTTPSLTVTTTYYVQTTVASCPGPRTAVTVTVSPVPAAPTASGTTICNGSTATLTATAPGGTYAWYNAASGGTLLITNASYTTPVLSTNTTYYAQTTVAGCAGPRTAVTVTVTPTPSAPTAAGTTICTGTTAALTATTPGGTYAWYDAASGGTLLVTNASYTTPTLTVTTTYYVQTTIASCPGPRTAVTVTISPVPAAPTASGTTICNGSTATLTATAPGGTYAWYDMASGGTLLITNASYTTPALAANTTYYVQTTVAGCAGPRTAITVTVTPTPAAPTAAGKTICTGTTATLTATAPGGTYAWYNAASGGTLLVTNSNYTTPTLTVTTTYYVQTTVVGCAGPRTAATVTVSPVPASPTAANTTICNGSAATVIATAPGGSYQWYDASSGGTLLVTNATYTTPVLSANTIYYVQTTVAGCAGPRTAVTVIVNPIPSAPTATGAIICQGSSSTLTATAPGGSYQWYDASWGGTLLITNASYTTPALSTTTTYYVQTIVGGCTSTARTAVTVTVTPTPATPTAAGSGICNGGSTTLTASAPGGTYDWYNAASGGTLLITNANYTTPVLSATTTYYVQTTIAGCTSLRKAVTVTVNPIPASPTAANAVICNGTKATLTATAPGGTYAWYDAASGGTLLITNASYTTPVLSGNTTYYVQTTIAGCISNSRTPVTVTVSPIPASPTAVGAIICQGTSTTLTATAPGGTYDWYNASSGGTLLITSANYITPALSATTTYYVQTTIGGCASPRTAVTATVTPTPATPNASGTTICNGSTATLTAIAPGGTYDWYDASSGGMLLITNASYTTPALSATTTYYVQTTISGCTSLRKPVTVTVTPIDDPTFNYSSGTYCVTGPNPTPSITGGFTGTFSSSPAGLIFISTSTGQINISASSLNTYAVTYTTNGPCPDNNTVNVTITNSPNATFTYSGLYCQGGSNPLPSFNAGASAGVFSASPGGLTFSSSSTGEIDLTATTPGTYTLTNTIAAAGGCAAASNSASVIINPAATVYAGASQNICAGSTATLAGSVGGAATSGIWSGGTGSFSSNTNLNAIYTSGPGETKVILTLTTNDPVGPCGSVSDTLIITINPIPLAPTSLGDSICAGTSTTLTATAPGGTYKWYSAASGGTLLVSNGSYTTPTLTVTTTYYVQTTLSGCTSNSRTPVTVTVNPLPMAPTAAGTAICSGNTATVTTTAPGGIYDWYDAAFGGNLLTTNTSYTTPVLTTTTTYYVQTTIAGCTSPRTSVTVTVNPIPASPTASNATICDGSKATLTATAPGGTYEWYDAATGGTLLITNASYTTPVLSATTTYYVQTTILGCTSNSRTSVKVTINPIPVAPTASGATICQGTTATLLATAPGGTYNWYTAPSGGTPLFTGANYTTSTLTTTTTYYVQATVLGCTSNSRTSVKVTITPSDDPSFNYSSGTYCVTGSDPTPTITGGFPGIFSSSPTGLSLNTSNGTIDVSASTLGNYSIRFTTTGPCPASNTTNVTITNALDATFSYSGAYCQIGINPSPTFGGGASAGIFSAVPAGLNFISTASGVINLTTSTPGTYTVTNTIAASGGCAGASHLTSVTINPAPTVNAGLDQTICTGSTATLAGIIGGSATSGTWSGGTGFFSANTNLNAVYTPGSGETIATLTLTTNDPIGPCGSVSDVVVINIRKDTSSFNYSAGTYCISGTNPIPIINGGYTGTFSSIPTGLVFVNIGTGEINLGGSTLTTYSVTFTTNGSCPDVSSANITITNAPDATFSYAGPYCQTDVNPSPIFGGSASAGVFSATPTGLSFVSISSGVINLATTIPGTYTVTNTIAPAGGCAAASNAASVTINPAAIVNAGPSQSICAGSNVTLAGTLGGAATTGTWSGGTGSFSLNTDLNAVYTPSPGETLAILTLTTNDPAGPCGSASDTMVITINPIPVAPTALSDTICSGASATLTATAPGGNYQWYNAASGGILLVSNTNYTTPNLTSNITYYVQTTVSGCTSSSRTPVTVTVSPKPITNANIDQTICSNNSVITLNGSVINAGGGTWTTTGSGTFKPNATTLNATYTPNVSDINSGSVMLILSSTNNGGCFSVMDTMLVTFSAKPVINAGTDQNICKSILTTTLNGIVSGGSTTGKWTTSGTGSFSPNDTTLNATYTPSTVDTTAGIITLILTSTNNGGCNMVKDTVVIVYTNTPTVNAGSNTTVCANNANVILSGSSSTGTASWSTSGDGTFNPNNTTLNATYIPGTNDTASKAATLTLTSTGGCSTVSKSIIVTITKAPIVNAGVDQFVCSTNLTVSLSGNVNGGSITGKWTTTGTGIFVPNDSTLNATYTMTTADTITGNILVVLTSSNNGNCILVKDTLRITYTSSPIAYAGSDMITCTNNFAKLNGTITGGSGTGIWTTTNGSGTFVPNNTTLNASYIPGNADTLAVNVLLTLTSTGVGGCGTSSDTLVITVHPGPVVYAGIDQTICSNNPNVLLSGSITVASGGIWTTTGTGTFSPNDSTLNTTYNPSVVDITSGVTLVLTSKGNGQCQPGIDTMNISFSPAPLVNAGSDIFICSGTMTTLLNGNISGGSTKGKWTTNGSGTFTPNDSTLNATYNFSTTDTIAGSIKLILSSINNGNCIAVVDTVIATITSVPVVFAGADTTVCANNANIVLNGIITGGSGLGKWTSNGTGIFVPNDTALNASYQPSATDITLGKVKLILTATKACLPVVDTVILSFTPAPTAIAGANQTICSGSTITLNGTINNAIGGKWASSGTGTFNPNNTTLNAMYVPSPADISSGTVKILLTTTGNGNCSATSDSLVITIQSKPTANFTSSTACLNTAVNFTDASTGSITAWSWNFGNGTSTTQNPTNIFTTSGGHLVSLIVSTNGGCVDTVFSTIYVSSLPIAAFSFKTFCPNSADFTDASTISPGTISSWNWNFGDSTSGILQNPTHTYLTAGIYVARLIVTSNSGCIASMLDTVKVKVCDDKKIIVGNPAVPSAFTPNGDGHNDILFVKGGPFKILTFRVFNEWGNEIFNTTSQSNGWDGIFKGQSQPARTYVWTVIGTTVDDKEIKMVGDVTLIR